MKGSMSFRESRPTRHSWLKNRFSTTFALVIMLLSLTPALALDASAAPGAPDAIQSIEGQAGTSSLEVHLGICPGDYTGSSLYDDCHDNGLDSSDFGLDGAGVSLTGSTTIPTTPGPGVVIFDSLNPGDYTLRGGPPGDFGTIQVFCTVQPDGDAVSAQVTGATATLSIAADQNIMCDWYYIPESAQGSPLGSISIWPVTCPLNAIVDPDAATFDELSTNCTTSEADITFTLTLPPDVPVDEETSDGINPVLFGNLDPGTYALTSSIPLEFASERIFCIADGGNRYEKEFDNQGRTIFNDLETETIECQWFVIPEDLRGDADSSLLEVHLSLCPAGYTGTTIYADCHDHGLDGYDFTLDGPSGSMTATTTIPVAPGPGIVNFENLSAGDYTLLGGPPGDFGTVQLFCTLQPEGSQFPAPIQGVIATLEIGQGQHIVCDWYFIPDQQTEPTPSPTEVPSRAEILVTLYTCPPPTNGTWGGASHESLQQHCTEPLDGVTFRLGHPDGAPISAKTGTSGVGAVRFYDLLPGDLEMKPSLPSDLSSVAVFCSIGGGEIYQKTLSNGGTTFVGVNGQSITCDWFAVRARTEPAPSATGSITIREYLCPKDRSAIHDWDQECTAGRSGETFTLTSAASGKSWTGTPNDQGVFVFTGLADGYYPLVQNTGSWCRAAADRVDSQNRVIVEGGGNTDVVIYQCGPIEGLPVTGSGTALPGAVPSTQQSVGHSALALLLVSIAAAAISYVGRRKDWFGAVTPASGNSRQHRPTD